MKNIYEYTNYRDYLSDWCTARRDEGGSFSYRRFAARAGLGSPSHLKMVMEGDRGLTPTTVHKFSRALGLKAAERRFFEDLVYFNQARTHTEKNHFYQRLFRHKQFRSAHHLTNERFEYLTKWYYVAIREMVGLPGFREDPTWIAKSLKPSIGKADAAEAIEKLLGLGLIERDAEGKLSMTERNVATADEVSALAVANFHRSMIERAGESIDLHKGDDRSITSLTVAMSKERFAQLKERLNEFRKELRSLLTDCEDASDVYQINFQLFSLTEVENES